MTVLAEDEEDLLNTDYARHYVIEEFSAVMAVLAAKPLDRIKSHVQKAMGGSFEHKPNGYQALAEFIIEGSRPQVSRTNR